MTVKDIYPIDIDALKESIRGLSRYGLKGFYCSQKTLELLDAWKSSLNRESQECLRKESSENNKMKGTDAGSLPSVIIGRGQAASRLFFVAPWPDYSEKNRLPYKGEEGVLFTKIISAMKLSPDDLFMCHILKSYPVGLSSLTSDERHRISAFIDTHIENHHPEVLCTLGEMATQLVLSIDSPLQSLRGQFYSCRNVRVMPTFHPFDLLKEPEKKRDVWSDMKHVMKVMGISV